MFNIKAHIIQHIFICQIMLLLHFISNQSDVVDHYLFLRRIKFNNIAMS